LKEVETEMIDHVMDFVSKEGKAMPGVHNCLEFFKRNGYQIGLASSSFMRLIQHTVQVLKIDDYFDCIHSAEFETYGKPHPAVYLHAAKQLNCPPEACLAIEDSFNGLLAAKSAKMKTIAVPDPSYSKMERFVIADWVVPSLEVLSDEQALVQFLESSI
jgi:HAD superfamily hydrolase (TIGR01509 family)